MVWTVTLNRAPTVTTCDCGSVSGAICQKTQSSIGKKYTVEGDGFKEGGSVIYSFQKTHTSLKGVWLFLQYMILYVPFLSFAALNTEVNTLYVLHSSSKFLIYCSIIS